MNQMILPTDNLNEKSQVHPAMRVIRAGEVWCHYKGDKYRIIGISRHTEDLSWYVVYEALYENAMSQIWHRPIDMFLGSIEVDGIILNRFNKVEEN